MCKRICKLVAFVVDYKSGISNDTSSNKGEDRCPFGYIFNHRTQLCQGNVYILFWYITHTEDFY